MSAESKFASRKFIVSLVVIGITVWMRFRGVLSDESTVTLLVSAMLGYQGGNVAEKFLAARGPQ